MRYAFVKTLIEQAEKNKKITLLTADLGYTVFEEFRDKFSDRFINVGVAEQNMIGIATGLALVGKIVFVYSIATFATMRAFEQIRNDIAIHNLPVIIVGSGAGLSYGTGSITHHAIEDVNLMRGIPNMTIICPADPLETIWATKQAIKINKPVYLRIGKKGEPNIYDKHPNLKIGKPSIIQKGKEIVIFAMGNIVYNTLQAVKTLNNKNIRPTVISFHTIKPIDKKIIKIILKTHHIVITVEEHSIIGGLGTTISEILAEENLDTILFRIGIPDKFIFKIGSQIFLRKEIGLDAESLAEKIYTLSNNLR